MTLFEDGKKIGEISEWKLIERQAEKKTFLGKEVMMPKPKDQCQFVSPKPVSWKKQLWIIKPDGTKLNLTEVRVTGATTVTATLS
ncbi:MAG: hypothetical protein V4692_01735 [Bdellovibrionota bacterium]